MEYLNKKFSFKIDKKNSDLQKGQFRGYASTYDVDLEGERFMPGSFDRDLRKNNARGLFFVHAKNKENYLGRAELITDDKGVYVERGIIYDVAGNQSIIMGLQDGTISEMSIGVWVGQSKINGAVRELYDNSIQEVSLVPVNMAANPQAQITEAKTRAADFWEYLEKNKHDRQFIERILSAVNFKPQERFAMSFYKAYQKLRS
jgi:HK97 family phage prohead protease